MIIRILFILFISTSILHSQDLDKCRQIVNLTVSAINNQSSTSLEAHLAEDFTIAGQQGIIAKMVMTQLFQQLGDEVISHRETSHQVNANELILLYDFVYKEKGSRETTFRFNSAGKLNELILFEMEVKTMSADESKIESKDTSFIEIPFKYAGKLIMMEAILDGVRRNFILDSGAPKVILNSKYVDRDTSRQSISSSMGVNGPVKNMDLHQIDKLEFAGQMMRDQQVISIDLSSLEDELDYEIHGLIGYELIKDYDLLFDYKSQTVTFISPDAFSEYADKNLNGKQVRRLPMELEGHIPVISSTIAGKEIKYGIDCGAETNLLDDDLYDQFKGALNQVTTDTLSGADRHRKEVTKANVNSTILGDVNFENLETVFSDISHINAGYKIKIDGLIGYQVLSKQLTLMSFARKELCFFSNSL